jgi:hypothetical protein
MVRRLALLASTLSLSLAATGCEREAAAATLACVDEDGDGVEAAHCGGTDCDDHDALRWPGAIEICDAGHRDEDCDPMTLGSRDSDGDGFDDDACCNRGSDGALVCGRDCNDHRANIHPLAPEVCDGVDQDCDGAADDQSSIALFIDADLDGYGDGGRPALACPGTEGFSALGNDCNDANPAIHPGSQNCGKLANQVQICTSAGTLLEVACSGAQELCRVQPNGTGVCL